jgi:hypothetical protein
VTTLINPPGSAVQNRGRAFQQLNPFNICHGNRNPYHAETVSIVITPRGRCGIPKAADNERLIKRCSSAQSRTIYSRRVFQSFFRRPRLAIFDLLASNDADGRRRFKERGVRFGRGDESRRM